MLTFKEIIAAASNASGFCEEAILSKSRTDALATTRQVCAYLMFKHTYMSKREIAVELKMDRSNVQYAVKQIKFKLQINHEFTTALLNELTTRLSI